MLHVHRVTWISTDSVRVKFVLCQEGATTANVALSLTYSVCNVGKGKWLLCMGDCLIITVILISINTDHIYLSLYTVF